VIGVLCVVAAAFAASAFAHSVLIFTAPANDTVVQESPDEVLLRFNEPVDPSLGSIRVFDGQGNQVDAGEIRQPVPAEVSVGIDQELDAGTYTVAWRVISADSDPISGAFVFHVRERGVAVAIEDVAGGSRAVETAFTVSRFFNFSFLLLAVGSTAVLLLALASASWRIQRRLYGLVAIFGGALLVTGITNILLQGAEAGGYGLLEAVSWDTFSTVVGTDYGEVMLIQAALAATLGLTALAVRYSQERDRQALTGLMLLLCAGLAVTPTFSGHARTVSTLAIVADIAHVAAAAVWTGGLGFLVLALLLSAADRWPLATRAVPRFSNMAVVSVVVLLVAGTISSYLQLRTWSALWETTYGLLILAKILLVVPLLGLGAYNNRYAVPRLKAGIASLLERRRFLQAAGVEIAIMAVIVAVTAVLVNAQPARTEGMAMGDDEHGAMTDGMEHAGGEQTVEVDLIDAVATVSISPGTPGDNTIEIVFEGPDGGPPPDFQEVSVSARLPAQEIGPLEFVAEPAHGGMYVIENASLSLPGQWELRIEALIGDFDLLTDTVTIDIGEG
jgi:copper transport protein